MNRVNGRRWFAALLACFAFGLGTFGCTSKSEEHVGTEASALETQIWQKLSPATPPGVREQHAMAFDSARGRTVLFGGDNGLGPVGGTFEWDGTDWTARCTTTPCSTQIPGARKGSSLAFDSTRGVSVLFGGRAGADLNETWEWDGSGSGSGTGSWTPKCTTGPCNTAVPQPRRYAGLAFDSTRHVTVLFGGGCSGGTCPAAPNNAFSDTWEWNGTAWTQKCTTAPCTDKLPPGRSGTSLAYDSSRGVTVMFGGLVPVAGGNVQDTWEWNGSIWAQKCTTGCTPPGIREAATLAYDSARKRVVLFGGVDDNVGLGGADASTWEWDGSTWTKLTLSGPSATQFASSAYDSARGRVVLFGGLGIVGGNQTELQETWEYHSYGAACTLDAQCDSGHCVDKVCCETTCTGTCFSCNQAGKEGICTAVKSAEDDTCKTASYCNAGGTCATKLTPGTACSTTVQCASGVCSSSDGVCCDSDCTGLCQSCVAAKTGKGAGVCSPVTIATDPDTECSDAGAASCGQNGSCNGAGACQKYAAATVCLAQSCTGATQTNASTCNGTGTCQAGTSSDCATGYVCSGNACPTMCSGDGQCAVGYFCSNKACVLKHDNGTTCAATNECKTGFCVDKVCCDKACSGSCQACTNAKKGSGTDGTCGNVADNTDPDDECANPATNACSPGGLCDGTGKCQTYVKTGLACGTTTCSAGSQAGKACDGAGNCGSVGQVDCAPFICGATACLSTCAKDADCTTGNYCNAGKQCVPKQGGGAVCNADAECANGICADKVCCNSRCDGLCESCLASQKGTGSDGTCGAIATGTDPGDECTDDRTQGAAPDPNSCQHNGACDSGNKCAFYAQGVACGAVSCQNNAVTGKICTGTGSCTNSASGVDCGAFKCAGEGCKNPCSADTDCTMGNYCAPNGECVTLKPIAAACDNANECAQNYCVDGFCCDSDCKGQCQACDNPSSHGVCSPTKGTPHTGRPACDGDDGSDCAGSCNGKNAAACTYPGATTSCGVSCTGAQQTDSVCAGDGSCKAKAPVDCDGNFTCDETAGICKTACATDADCVQPYVCDEQGMCSPPATSGPVCDGDHTVKTPGKPNTDCSPYLCAGSTCKSTCTSVDDCVSPAICDESHQCVAPDVATAADSSKSDSGCGCRAAGGGTPSPTGGLAGLVLAFAAVRRRARARRAGRTAA
jgi:MYXO-CTERM domain-containing protein